MSRNNGKNKENRMHDPVRPRLMTVEQTAEYLGWHPNTVRSALLYSHEVPVIRLSDNGKVWIDQKDLDAWLEKKKSYVM
jgi:excisionase family DNA binding protein